MCIHTGNAKPSDIFGGYYQPGSDGKTIVPEPKKEELIPANETYKGYISESGNKIYLKTLGGGRFELDLSSTIDHAEYVNKLITVMGRQVSDTIVNASIVGSKTPVSVTERAVDPKFKTLADAVKKFLNAHLGVVENLLTARPGYKYENGVITKTPAIVAVVDRKINIASVGENNRLPNHFDNFDVEVVTASPKNLLRYKYKKTPEELSSISDKLEPTYLESLVSPVEGTEAALLEATEISINYTPPPGVELEEVTQAMTLHCHVSPEGGWKKLQPFLEDTNEHLQVAMYDFSAPQLFETLKNVVRNGASLKLVYDGKAPAHLGKGTKIDDVSEETILKSLKRIAGNNIEYVKAWKGKAGICYNSYHTKIAVKDEKSFWLSSGNWQSSNQPNIDFENNLSALKDYNREWNIIVDNPKLSKIFHKYIDWDFEQSEQKPEAELFDISELPELFLMEEEVEERAPYYQLFAPRKFVFTRSNPVTIQPVMSPDNYMEHALKLIRSAKKTLYFQNQYITIPKNATGEYLELLQALCDKSNDPKVDCRIIVRKAYSEDDKVEMLDNLQALGFDMSKIKFMGATHTKGIIADGKVIMIGSHNWSNPGVQFNRDASLVIYNEEVAQYYQEVFLHDWEKRTIRSRTETESVELDMLPSVNKEQLQLEGTLRSLYWKDYLE